jgi:hypothetical protein
MVVMRRLLAISVIGCVFAGAALASSTATFPRLQLGIGNESTAGGGMVAGAPYRTHSAFVAWNRRRKDLTLYLVRARGVDCRNLIKVARRPGNLIQAVIKARPLANYVYHRLPDQTLQFVTHYADTHRPLHDAGLRQGVKLVLTRVDSYPGGVWHGRLTVPTKVYGDGKVYGYRGTFAAGWCDLKH